MKGKSWQYDEFQQVGTDYGSVAEAEEYDSIHSDFRDIVAESKHVLDGLSISSGCRLIDFGSGTATFAIQAAKRCKKVYAVDVSRAMIEVAKRKAEAENVSNVNFHHAGYLTYDHREEPVDAVTSTFSFHHLPDYWKGIALGRIHDMLREGGQFYIHDVIIEEKFSLDNISSLINKLEEAGGMTLREDTERHFREEFSTYDWVMDGLLKRAGFEIKHKELTDGVLGTYFCVRK